jgi:soluble lytic murein transglycosylase-like protein
MRILLLFISALALGVGSGQYYIQHKIPTSSVLALEIEEPEISPTPTVEPTATPMPTPTETPTPMPRPSPMATAGAATPTNSPKPKAKPTPTVTVIVTVIPTVTPAPVATLVATYSLVIAPADLEPIFSEMASKYNVDANLLKKIADCESHFNAGVVSPNGLYAGMFQFTVGTWVSNRNAMGMDNNPDLRFGKRESIETAAFLLANRGPGAWPACSR